MSRDRPPAVRIREATEDDLARLIEHDGGGEFRGHGKNLGKQPDHRLPRHHFFVGHPRRLLIAALVPPLFRLESGAVGLGLVADLEDVAVGHHLEAVVVVFQGGMAVRPQLVAAIFFVRWHVA